MVHPVVVVNSCAGEGRKVDPRKRRRAAALRDAVRGRRQPAQGCWLDSERSTVCRSFRRLIERSARSVGLAVFQSCGVPIFILHRPLTHWGPGFGVRLVIPVPMSGRSGRKQIVGAFHQNHMAVTEEDVVTLRVRRSGFRHSCQGPGIHLDLPGSGLATHFRPGIRNGIHLARGQHGGFLPAVLPEMPQTQVQFVGRPCFRLTI